MGWPWEIGGWKEKDGGERARGKGEKETGIESEEKWKEKKNQANWYAAHNNRRVERRGSEVRPARGSYVWREGGINTLSFSSRLLLHVRRHAHESERVDTRERTCTRSSTAVVLLFLFFFLPSFLPFFFIGRPRVPAQQPVANPETPVSKHSERHERKRERKRRRIRCRRDVPMDR